MMTFRPISLRRRSASAIVVRSKREPLAEDPHTMARGLNRMSVAHRLERIADHATHIAEEIVVLYEGRDIRHQTG